MIESYQKRLGIFYTPEWLAGFLVGWAFSDGPGKILDPSFGGCAVLKAALNRLEFQCGRKSGSLVYGFDVDRNAIPYADELVQLGVPPQNLRFQDFFKSEIRGYFKAVVGNPPYIRHHRMPDRVINRAQQQMQRAGVTIPKTASAWAYFVVHSTAHLSEGGCLALLLPGAILHADYARPLKRFLSAEFASVTLLHVHERLFQDAREETVVLLARGRGGKCTMPRYVSVGTIQDLCDFLGDTSDAYAASESVSWKLQSMPPEASRIWEEIVSSELYSTVGDVARVKIGVVTGANDFFVRSACDETLRYGFTSSVPIITSGSWLRFPIWKKSDQRNKERQQECRSRLLLIESGVPRRSRIFKKIRAAQRLGVHERYHCKRREFWYALNDFKTPHVLLPYMGARPLPMARNAANATSTNAVHRIWLNDERALDSIIVSSWSSLYELAAEIHGRSYGGGILKIEPKVAKLMPVIDVPCGSLERIDAVSRTRGWREARDLADDIVLRGEIGLSASDVALIRTQIDLYRERRHSPRADSEIGLSK